MKKDENVKLAELDENLDIISEAVNELEVASEEVNPENVEEEIYNRLSDFKNIPYKKILNVEGDIVNPITKEDPYNTMFMSSKQRRDLIKKATKNPKNNKKGARVVITKLGGGTFTKAHVRKQVVKANVIPQLDENFEFVGFKDTPSKTILHNDFKH